MVEFDENRWRRVDTITVDGPVAVIGDIHGRLDLLQQLVRRLDVRHPEKKMPLFVVGDVIDRGPDSRGVVDLLVARGARGVRGNHEEWFARFSSGAGLDSLALNDFVGGRAALRSYGIDGTTPRTVEAEWRKVPPAHREWVTSLPAVVRLVVSGAPFWLVHAGVSNSAVTVEEPVARMHDLARDNANALVWESLAPDEMAVLDAPLVTGHAPRKRPVDVGHALAIDTGCGVRPDGKLTAVVLPDRTFVSVGEDD
jgi:serine/threonine protein phosphatase 1